MALNRTRKADEKVAHSSLRLFNSSPSDFPNSDPRLGVIVRTYCDHNLDRTVAEIYDESPRLTSIGIGNSGIELDDVDSILRDKLMSISKQCRLIADELLEHAKRLKSAAMQEDLLDNDSNLDIDNQQDQDDDEDDESEMFLNKPTIKPSSPKLYMQDPDHRPKSSPWYGRSIAKPSTSTKSGTKSGARGRPSSIDFAAGLEEDEDEEGDG